jgi:hypothetical protein
MTSILKKHMPDAYKRAARALGFSLLLNTADAWHGLTIVLSARLTWEQRAALAWSSLRALPPETVVEVTNAVCPKHTAPPLPPLISYMDEATFWADMAEPEALEAYCLASFDRMAPARQSAFLNHVMGRAAA